MKNLLKSNQRFFVSGKGRWLPAIVLVAAIIFAGCKKTADIPCNSGSLEKGKWADMVLLSKNLSTCGDEEILSAKVLMTIVGGEVKYRQ